MELVFGDGTNSDTWDKVFGGLIGYTIGLTYKMEDSDESTTVDGTLVDLRVMPWSDAGMVLRKLDENGLAAVVYQDEIERVWIY